MYIVMMLQCQKAQNNWQANRSETSVVLIAVMVSALVLLPFLTVAQPEKLYLGQWPFNTLHCVLNLERPVVGPHRTCDVYLVQDWISIS
jgi:hypothetical protein